MRKILRKILPLKVKIFMLELLEWLYLPIIFIINNKSNESNSIVLLHTDALGDFVIWLNAAGEIRKTYPGKRIILVCTPVMESLAKCTGYFDQIVTVTAKIDIFNPLLMYRLYKELCGIQAQITLQFVLMRSLGADFVAAAICSEHKIAIYNRFQFSLKRFMTHKRIIQSSKIYDKLIQFPNYYMHQIQIDALILRFLGHAYASKINIMPKLPVDRQFIPDGEFFILSPGASDIRRCWETDKFASIITYIQDKTNLKCCLCGSLNERKMADRIINLCGSDDIINMVGRTDILQLTEVVRAAEFVVCNDTGIVHLAVAVATPSLCICGQWETGVYLPYDADDLSDCKQPLLCYKDMPCALCDSNFTRECLKCQKEHGKRLCIYNVSVDDVKAKVDELMAENNIEVNGKNEESS